MMTLDSMIMAIPDTAQVRRVKEIKQLVIEKKGYLLAIHQDLEQLRDVSGLMQQKMPQDRFFQVVPAAHFRSSTSCMS